jgi:transcriptional regulator with XRE-family HTH domain
MSQDTEDATDLPVVIAMFNGLCKRVAARLGVHQTMVSRVAHGERQSPQISAAILDELRVIRDYLNRSHKSNGQ